MGKTGENKSEVIYMRDKQKLTSAATLALVMALLAVGWFIRDRNQAPQPPMPEPVSAISENAPYQFLLKTKNKNLELFHVRDGAWRKLADFPITLGDLPAADRALLEAGLVLRDAGELQRSLEDYLPNS